MSVALSRLDATDDSIERMYLLESRPTIYTACEEMNFQFSLKQVRKFDEAWKTGVPLADIADEFDRDPDELLILMIDRAKGGHIKSRMGSVLGWAAFDKFERQRLRLTIEQRETVVKLLDQGISGLDLAMLTGVPTAAIYYLKKRARDDIR